MSIAGGAVQSSKLRRSGMERIGGGSGPIYAAPTELGGSGAGVATNMSLLTELAPPRSTLAGGRADEQMKHAIALDVPIEVEIGAGENWLEAH